MANFEQNQSTRWLLCLHIPGLCLSAITYGEMPSRKRDHQLVQIYIHIYALSTYIASSPGLKVWHIPCTQTSQLVAQQCSSLAVYGQLSLRRVAMQWPGVFSHVHDANL